MMFIPKQALLAELASNEANHIAFLQRLIQARSPNPPGDCRDAADVVISYLKSHGIHPEVISAKPELPNVVADFCCSTPGARLILNGHLDVFPAGAEEDWTPGRGPWSGAIDKLENRIYGRGVIDMKAGTAASIIVYAYLYKYRARLAGSVGLTAVSDEETGGRFGARYLLDTILGAGQGDKWKGDVMLNGEPSGMGTIRFAEKGTLRITFTVNTHGGHGAYVHASESATIVAAEIIIELKRLIDSIEPDIKASLKKYMEREDVKRALDDVMGSGAADIALSPTLNIGTLNGGLKVNMIPAQCVFEADIRLPLGLVAEDVLKLIHKNILVPFSTRSGIALELAVQEAASNPAAACPYKHPLVDAIIQNARDIGLRRPLAVPSLGATDCKFWRRLNIPAYSYGVDPGNMGTVNESADLQEFLDVIKVHACAAWDFLTKGDL